MRWRSALPLLAALTAAACGEPPEAGPASVPAAWREVRESPNHQRHLAAGVPCAGCHKSQDFTDVKPTTCLSCHDRPIEGIHATTATATRIRDAGCARCHNFRSATPPTAPCLECHETGRHDAPVIHDHPPGSCASCHRPHTEKPLSAAPCLTCHLDRAAAHGPKPQDCHSCHKPHEPKSSAKEGCARCHATEQPIVTLARSIPRHKQCTDCHAPHALETGGFVPCEKCHDKQAKSLARPQVSADRVSHGCRGCHPPHREPDDPARGPRPCAFCHTDIAPDGYAHAPRAQCVDCHQPHAPPKAPVGLDCNKCHADLGAAKGHSDCRSCHVDAPHAPRLEPVGCPSCHAEIAARAPEGHRDCLKCHGLHAQVKPEATRCVTCHEKKADQLHGGIEGGCRNCHAPHDGQPPRACTTCHDRGKLSGLHALDAHADCSRCHGGHAPPARDRATCITCHASKTTHYPEARRCAACHAFAPQDGPTLAPTWQQRGAAASDPSGNR